MACKADPKRRRKKRIGKRGRELVFEITSPHLPPPFPCWFTAAAPPRAAVQTLLTCLFFSPPLFLPGSLCQWSRDEPRTQTEKGWKWHQYVRRLARTAHSSAHRRAALNCQPSLPQILSKTARARPPTRRSQPRKRKASAPNRPAKRRPRRWSPSAPPPGAKRSPTATACSQTVHPCCPLPLIWTPSRLCCRSPGTRKRNQKRKKRETAPEAKKRKSNILEWSPKIRILLTFSLVFFAF